jgi:lambda family phage portal protein
MAGSPHQRNVNVAGQQEQLRIAKAGIVTERKPKATPPKTLADKIGGMIDRAVYVVSPERGARRMALRKSFDRRAQNSAHDGAESTKLRDGAWLGSRLSPDSAVELDLQTSRTRSRELYRTDSIGGAIDSRTNLVVSYGFTPQARIKARDGLATEEQAKKWNDELEEVYHRIYPRMGKNGKQSLWQLLRLVERHHGCDGESVTILSDRADGDKPIPLTLEVVDPERLATPPGMIGNPRCRMGVEYDDSGKIIAYHIRQTHPGDTLEVNEKFTRYPAARVLHVFEPWFAGQSRGLPWMTRSLNRCRDAKDLDDAAITAAQVQACYAAFVTSPAGGYDAAVGAATETANGRRFEDIQPGTIRYLDVGEKVDFGNPSQGNGYAPMQEWNYRRAAAGMNYPYEMVTKNWGGLSFAAGRLSLAETRLMVTAEQKLLNEAWLQVVWARLVEESVIVGAVSIPSLAYSRDPWWFQQHEWRSPAWPFALTPGEEINAKITAIDNNLITKASVIGELGGDREEVFADRMAERKAELEMGIEPAASKVPDAQIHPQQVQPEQVAA